MLRYIVFILLCAFTEWLWAGSCNTALRCPVKPVKKAICPLQKKLYVDLGVSKTLTPHLASAQIHIMEDINFSVDPVQRGTGIFPDTLQIGVGYAWFRNSLERGFLPSISVGVEYRKMNPVHYPLTLDAKVFPNDLKKGEIVYESIPLENKHLFATIKMNPFKMGCVLPYVSAGLGVSWLQAHDQQVDVFIKGNDDAGTVRSQLPAIKQVNLGFRFGSGVDLALTQNLLMSIGYSYNNLGKLIVRKPNACIAMPEEKEKNLNNLIHIFRAMNLGRLTTHNIEFSLRYLFA